MFFPQKLGMFHILFRPFSKAWGSYLPMFAFHQIQWARTVGMSLLSRKKSMQRVENTTVSTGKKIEFERWCTLEV